jgi:hypothetical protein
MTEQLFVFDLTIGKRTMRYRTRASSESEARQRAEAFAKRLSRTPLADVRGADDGLAKGFCLRRCIE